MTASGSYLINYGGHAVEIGFNNADAANLIQYLVKDLDLVSTATPESRLDVVASGPKPMLSLWENEKRIYFGDSHYRLAEILVNEVIYRLVNNNRKQHALHAGAVTSNGHGIILPAQSGKGKSTLTGWLISRGYRYLTDELVLLSDSGQIEPFTRPISFKTTGSGFVPSYLEQITKPLLVGEHGMMVPHRVINNEYEKNSAKVERIIFPEFREGTAVEIEEISPTRSCHRLLESHVNGRNFSGLGISGLANIVRECRSFNIHYSRFESLEQFFRVPHSF